MTKYRFTSAALSELTEATLHYEQKENGLGTSFLDEIDAALERVLRFPRAWHPVSARTRRCRTHRFPFGLLYQIRSDENSDHFRDGLASRSAMVERLALKAANIER